MVVTLRESDSALKIEQTAAAAHILVGNVVGERRSPDPTDHFFNPPDRGSDPL
jgi:hypothetical protein